MWNVLDCIILSFTFIINLLNMFDYEWVDQGQNFKSIAAIVVLCFMVKLFEWMKIFEQTAFYISLIQ